MKHSIWAALVLALTAMAWASVGVTLTPAHELKQGSILIVNVTSDKPNLKIDFDGHSSPCFSQADGSCQAIFGVSVDTPAGAYPISVNGEKLAQAVVKETPFPKQNIVVSKTTNGLQPLPGELEAIQALKDSLTPVRFWAQPLMSPTPDCENSPFGVKRYHNGVYIHDYHKGVDLRAPYGAPIHAVAGGIVKIAAPKFRLHGGTVGIDHGQGLSSIYIHMSKVLVTPGQQVHKGDVIGLIGSTGFATGPHLHWGLYAGGVPVNPDQWVPVKRCS